MVFVLKSVETVCNNRTDLTNMSMHNSYPPPLCDRKRHRRTHYPQLVQVLERVQKAQSQKLNRPCIVFWYFVLCISVLYFCSSHRGKHGATIERIHHLASNQLQPSAHTITCQISQICMYLYFFCSFFLWYFCTHPFNLLKAAAPTIMWMSDNSDFHMF